MEAMEGLRSSACRLLAMALWRATQHLKLGSMKFYMPAQDLLPLHQQTGEKEEPGRILIENESSRHQTPSQSTLVDLLPAKHDLPCSTDLSSSPNCNNGSQPEPEELDLADIVKHEDLQLFLTTNTLGVRCLALQMNLRLLSEIEEHHKEKKLLNQKKESLEQLRDRRFQIQDAIYQISGYDDTPPSDINEQEAARLLALRSRIDQIDDLEDQIRGRIEIAQSNLKASGSFIYSQLEAVFLEGNLLPQVALSNEDDLMELDMDEGVAHASDESMNQPEPVRTAEEIEELEKQTARDDCQRLGMELLNAEREMEWKEMRYQANYRDYLQCVEEGITDWTKSDFDRKLLLDEQEYTQRLIQIEMEFDVAVERAEALGAWDNGEDQSSYYGHSQCASESVVAVQNIDGRQQTQADIESSHRILSWVAGIEGDPCLVSEESCPLPSLDPMCEDDEVRISDSLSVVADDTTWRRKIQRYHARCESLRLSLLESSKE